MATLGKYIVVFRDDTSPEVIDQAINDVIENGGQVNTRWDEIMKGFSATIPEAHLETLKSLQGGSIEYIEPDGIVTIQ